MILGALSTYRPCWLQGESRIGGADEDALTMAVAAALPLVETGIRPRRLVVVTRTPTQLQGDAAEVLAAALRLGEGTPVEVRLGGGPDVLDALTSSPEGTVVVAVAGDAPAGAAAALVGGTEGLGTPVVVAGSVRHSLPLVVDHPHAPGPRSYADPRLLRERGWRPAVDALCGDTGPVLVVGAPASLGAAPPVDPSTSASVGAGGAAAPLFALDALVATGAAGRVVAVEGASAVAVDAGAPQGTLRLRAERPGRPAPAFARDDSTEIPISLAAYERAFPARVGLLAGRCPCGHQEIPPPYRCPSCGVEGKTELVPLPREASVYSVVTVRTSVPGLETPYSLAVVEVEGTSVRLLVRLTGADPGSVGIGARGRLVLRRVATRQGVDDYGYAFEPKAVPAAGALEEPA